jgi:hypothetical protein
MSLTAYAGDSLTFAVDLIDATTGTAIDGTTVAEAWASVGATVFEAPAVTVVGNTIQTTLAPADTLNLRGTLGVAVKVRLSNGTLAHVAQGDSINFISTNLKDKS